MSNLTVTEFQGQNVVDSRLVAEELGIKHKNFLATIRKYEADIIRFGVLAFQTAKPPEGSNSGRPEVFCYLNEDQATFVMTLSKNTERVINCKLNLVTAFRDARKVISQQGDRIKELELALELKKAEQKLLDTRNTIVQTCPEPVQQKILGYSTIERVEYRDRIIQDDEVIRDGSTINKGELCRRYGLLSKNGNPNYSKLKKLLKAANLPDDAWKPATIVRDNLELSRDVLPVLDMYFNDGDRQLFLGE